jgi:hypothetical protein
MSTEKIYLCKQIKDSKICGETNSEKFQKGRYSSCKECRNSYIRDYNKRLYEEEKSVKNMNLTKKITDGKGDLGKNVHDLIIHILETYPLDGIGIALPMKFEDLETERIQDYTRNKDRIDELEIEIERIQKKFKILETENQDLKKEIYELKNQKINNID